MADDDRELSRLLSEVVFNLEHGVPLAVLDGLAALGRRLSRSAITAADVADFRYAVEALRNGEPDSLDRMLLSGERLLSELASVHATASL